MLVILYYRSYCLFVVYWVLLIYFQYYEFMAFVMICMLTIPTRVSVMKLSGPTVNGDLRV